MNTDATGRVDAHLKNVMGVRRVYRVAWRMADGTPFQTTCFDCDLNGMTFGVARSPGVQHVELSVLVEGEYKPLLEHRARWRCRLFGHRYVSPLSGRPVHIHIPSAEGGLGSPDRLPVGVCGCGAAWVKDD